MGVGPIILAYFAAWSIYGRSYNVKDIPADKLTHINYAFANIGSDGRIAIGDSWADTEKTFGSDTWDQPLRGNFNQLIQLKKKYPHLRTLISVGGWTWSTRFSDVALTDQSRSIFAASCLEFIQKYGFDGVDLDWEYPVSGGLSGNIHRPQDKQNYVLLLKELRQQLNTVRDKKYLLTVATGAGTERIEDMDLIGMIKYLDWINVMTYDFHGGWESKTGHNAPLYKNNDETVEDIAPSFIKSKYNCDAAIQSYLSIGVPSRKILLGLPLYGRGWQGVTNQSRNGFSQSASSQLPTGTWENGVFDYDHLKKSFLPTSKRYWDDKSKVPFLYNSSTGIWISYDDLQSIHMKNNYIKQNKLGGAFFWELSSDRQVELIGATFNALFKGSLPSITLPTITTIYNEILPWKVNTQYNKGQQVIYRGKIYSSIRKHLSNNKQKPDRSKSLWKSRNSPITTTKKTTISLTNNDASEWRGCRARPAHSRTGRTCGTTCRR